MNRLTPVEVLAIHDRVVNRTGGRHGVRDLGAVVSAVTRPFGGTSAGDFYPSLEQKAAALCHGLVREHPFADGNHRTAIAAAALLLERNGRRLKASAPDVVRFVEGVAGEHHRIDDMAKWFRTHTSTRTPTAKELSHG